MSHDFYLMKLMKIEKNNEDLMKKPNEDRKKKYFTFRKKIFFSEEVTMHHFHLK